MDVRHRRQPARAFGALLLLLSACAGGAGGERPWGGAVTLAPAGATEAFDREASRVRDGLDAAERAASEALLRPGAAETTRRAVARADQALREGDAILRAAARDGGRRAEGWARLIQDRMMRLDETLRRLAARVPEHAAS